MAGSLRLLSLLTTEMSIQSKMALGYIPDYGTTDGSESEAYESSTTEGWDSEVKLEDLVALAVNCAAVLIY